MRDAIRMGKICGKVWDKLGYIWDKGCNVLSLSEYLDARKGCGEGATFPTQSSFPPAVVGRADHSGRKRIFFGEAPRGYRALQTSCCRKHLNFGSTVQVVQPWYNGAHGFSNSDLI